VPKAPEGASVPMNNVTKQCESHYQARLNLYCAGGLVIGGLLTYFLKVSCPPISRVEGFPLCVICVTP